MTLDKRPYARAFGLPVDQVRILHELTTEQLNHVRKEFSLYQAAEYIYAVKRDGGLVSRRFKIDGREVRGW